MTPVFHVQGDFMHSFSILASPSLGFAGEPILAVFWLHPGKVTDLSQGHLETQKRERKVWIEYTDSLAFEFTVHVSGFGLSYTQRNLRADSPQVSAQGGSKSNRSIADTWNGSGGKLNTWQCD